MLALRSLAKAGNSAFQARQMSVISTKPFVRISFGEKLVHGVIIMTALSLVPVWVLVHIRSYRGIEK